MLLHPRTHLMIGATLVFFLCWQLALTAPLPGPISAVHARVHELTTPDGCATCHTDDGLAPGCLGCHQEIQAQLRDESGYHSSVMDPKAPTCEGCHSEHLGEGFPLTSELSWGAQVSAAYRHPHTEFALEGRHLELQCEECHVSYRDEPFRMERFPDLIRDRSFLGLDQACGQCHDDPHAGGLAQECGVCHGQDGFHPVTSFDHADHFALDGGHAEATCDQCHQFPHARAGEPVAAKAFPFPFDQPRGTECVECHDTPHRVAFEADCEACHPGSDGHWLSATERMTAEHHAEVGFALDGPHADVSCQSCHPSHLSFDQRHPDPNGPDYRRHEETCDGCHDDVHEGQFEDRYGACLDCHQAHRFEPTTFGHDAHGRAFPLLGAHRGVACSQCHTGEPTQFVGTAQSCRDCHTDPHAGQFASQVEQLDCVGCHRSESDTFAIAPFDHAARTGVTLNGAHARADCVGCHRETSFHDPATGHEVIARQYADTPTACASCHVDVHQGQFDHLDGCDTCHTSEESWLQIQFDHDRQTRFPLKGAHEKVLCSTCHLETTLEDGSRVTHYKPLDTECRSCHEFQQPR